MKRDMRLICQLLAHVECKQTEGPVEIPTIQDYSEGQVHYHVGLCIEAGYIDAAKPGMYSAGRRFSSIHRLTWQGHNALDDLRNGGTI